MKRMSLILILIALLIVPAAHAQSNPPGTACIVSQAEPDSALGQIAIAFRSLTDNLNLPQTPEVTLNCSSDPAALDLVRVSASVPLNTTAPRPSNPLGLAEAQTGYAIVDTGAANLRSGPGPQYTRVAIVDGGTRLVVLGRNLSESWWYVQADEIRGWVWADLLILRGDLTDVPYVFNEGELRTPTLYVGYTGNPIYDELTTAGEVICTTQGKLEYAVAGKNPTEDWYLVDAVCEDGTVQRGWISAEAGILREVPGVRVPVIR